MFVDGIENKSAIPEPYARSLEAMTTALTLAPVVFIAAFAMYVQYRTLSESRRRNSLWKALCVLPVLTVGVFLFWIAFRS